MVEQSVTSCGWVIVFVSVLELYGNNRVTIDATYYLHLWRSVNSFLLNKHI